MKNKKPNLEIVANKAEIDEAIVISSDESLKKYLEKASIVDELSDKEAEMYNFIRETMMANLTGKSRKTLVFACLIERIARTAVILDKLERYHIHGDRLIHKETMDFKNKEYSRILVEHRRCIEAYENLRWAGENKKSTKIIDKMREITTDWDEPTQNE